MRVVAVIQARMDSKRLPGKVLMDLNGMPVIQHIWRRLLKCEEVNEVCISWGCHCDSGKDARHCAACTERISESFGMVPRIWTGPEEDLVARHLGAGYALRADAVVRITGDCPLVDPSVVDEAVRYFKDVYPSAQAIANWYPKATLPDGLDLEIATLDVFQAMDRNKDAPKEEYLGYMVTSGTFKVRALPYAKEDKSDRRITLDTQEDHVALTRILKEIGNDTWDWRSIPEDLIPRMERPDYLAGRVESA